MTLPVRHARPLCRPQWPADCASCKRGGSSCCRAPPAPPAGRLEGRTIDPAILIDDRGDGVVGHLPRQHMDEIDDISQCAPAVARPCGSSSPAARVVAAQPVDHQIERLFSDAHNDLMDQSPDDPLARCGRRAPAVPGAHRATISALIARSMGKPPNEIPGPPSPPSSSASLCPRPLACAFSTRSKAVFQLI